MIQSTVENIGEKASEARSQLAAAVESAKATCSRLQEQVAAGARATDRVVRENPYPSLGIAFGLGVVIGVLVARR